MEFLSHHTTVEEYRLYPSQSGVVDHTYSHLLVPAGWHQVENSFTTNQPHRTVVSEAFLLTHTQNFHFKQCAALVIKIKRLVVWKV